MIVLTVFLYILGIITALLLLLGLMILVIPIYYRAEGGYESHPWFLFTVRCTPALVFSGSWGEVENTPFQAKFRFFGIPFNVDPKRFSKAESKEKDKEKKKGKKPVYSKLLIVLDRELQKRGIALVKDILKILKPNLFSLKGRIGFYEPHLTGWLIAVTNTLKYSWRRTFIDLDPLWDDEDYQFEGLIQGHIRVGAILMRVSWFFLVLKTSHIFNRPAKYETA